MRTGVSRPKLITGLMKVAILPSTPIHVPGYLVSIRLDPPSIVFDRGQARCESPPLHAALAIAA